MGKSALLHSFLGDFGRPSQSHPQAHPQNRNLDSMSSSVLIEFSRHDQFQEPFHQRALSTLVRALSKINRHGPVNPSIWGGVSLRID